MQNDNELNNDNNVSPLDKEDYPSRKVLPETPQTRSASFIPAYADTDFLLRDELRPARFQLELLKPELHAVHIIETEQDLDGSLRLELLSENLDQLIHRYDPELKVACHVIADENMSEGMA